MAFSTVAASGGPLARPRGLGVEALEALRTAEGRVRWETPDVLVGHVDVVDFGVRVRIFHQATDDGSVLFGRHGFLLCDLASPGLSLIPRS